MKLGYFNIALLNVILLATLSVTVYGNVYNLYYGQAQPISAETSKVILRVGTAGTTSIYINNTSAKVGVQAATDWLSGWDKRVKITINNSDIDEALTDFPVLVHLSGSSGENNDDVTSVFDEVGSNYNATAYTESDGTSRLYFEVEHWNTTSEKAWVWVKVPSISNTTDTDIYLYYDSSKDGSAHNSPTNVWDSNFEMVQHMNEVDGTIYDSTSNDNDGELKPTAQDKWVGGQVNNALSFDGSDDKVDCGNDESLRINETITIDLWVNISSFTNWRTLLHKKETNSYGDGYIIAISDSNDLFIGFKRYSTNAYATTGNKLSTNIWYHIVAVMNSTSVKLYYNGTDQGALTSKGGIAWGSTDLTIGDRGSGNRYINAVIDEIRIYNRMLNDTEISWSYERGKNGLVSNVSSVGLVGYWAMDEATGDTASDSSGEDNDGTLYGYEGNSPVSVSGKIGDALDFNGVSSYVEIDLPTVFDDIPNNDFTFELWTNIDDYSGHGTWTRILETRKDGSNFFQVVIQYNNGELGININDAGTRHGKMVSPTISEDTWYHVVGVWDASENDLKFYLDGASQSTEAPHDAAAGNLAKLNLGRRTDGNGYFNGITDEVRISNTTRNVAWTKASYETGRDDLLDFGSQESASYDYVLKVFNEVADNWQVNLKVYDSSNIARLVGTTISFYDGAQSDQIIVSNGEITQSEGPLYDLGISPSNTVYISMSNVQASTSGTSYLHIYLKILVPGTSTYNLFIITFEIT